MIKYGPNQTTFRYKYAHYRQSENCENLSEYIDAKEGAIELNLAEIRAEKASSPFIFLCLASSSSTRRVKIRAKPAIATRFARRLYLARPKFQLPLRQVLSDWFPQYFHKLVIDQQQCFDSRGWIGPQAIFQPATIDRASFARADGFLCLAPATQSGEPFFEFTGIETVKFRLEQ